VHLERKIFDFHAGFRGKGKFVLAFEEEFRRSQSIFEKKTGVIGESPSM
jgi:hypothetical protein